MFKHLELLILFDLGLLISCSIRDKTYVERSKCPKFGSPLLTVTSDSIGYCAYVCLDTIGCDSFSVLSQGSGLVECSMWRSDSYGGAGGVVLKDNCRLYVEKGSKLSENLIEVSEDTLRKEY